MIFLGTWEGEGMLRQWKQEQQELGGTDLSQIVRQFVVVSLNLISIPYTLSFKLLN